uniref:Uncharacterized protein n=1 Tax=Sphaerodactylus townsendi TaxID=933632 RepID=A0ACB8F7J9_9SAUR
MDYKPVMRVGTEEIGLSTIHGITSESLERYLDRRFEEIMATGHLQSTGARPKASQVALHRNNLDETESPRGGAQTPWPDEEIDWDQLVNLGTSHPASLPPGAFGDDEPVEPMDPLGADLSHEADVPGWPGPQDDPYGNRPFVDCTVASKIPDWLDRMKAEYFYEVVDSEIQSWAVMNNGHGMDRNR